MENVLEDFKNFIEDTIHKAVKKSIKEELPNAIRKANRSEFMTTKEVMDELSISSYATIQKLRDNGSLTYLKDGGITLYPRDSVEKYVQDHLIKGDY